MIKKRTKRSEEVSAEDFVRAWQMSSSVREVSERLGGKNMQSLRTRACWARAHGIPLKKMPSRQPLDVKKLKKIAKESLP